MKPTDLKLQFVELRAAGTSYNLIAERLHIAKSTCVAWEKELSEQISGLKKAKLAELCEGYGMAKEARIKRLGDTLAKIEAALAGADFSEMDPAKLLDFKLKYTDALKEEYASTKASEESSEMDLEHIQQAYSELLSKARDGDATTEQIDRENKILSQLLKVQETIEIKDKLSALEPLLRGARR